jgi:hypothetical protein
VFTANGPGTTYFELLAPTAVPTVVRIRVVVSPALGAHGLKGKHYESECAAKDMDLQGCNAINALNAEAAGFYYFADLSITATQSPRMWLGFWAVHMF